MAALVLVAAALVVAGVLRLTMHHRALSSAERAAPTPAAAATHQAPALSADQLGELVALHNNPATCPPTIDCTESTVLPAAFVAAVAGRLPTVVVRVMVTVTQTNPPRVYYRQLDGSADGVVVTVRVTRSDILDGLASTSRSRTTGPTTERFVRLVTPSNYEVVVEVSGLTAHTPPLALLRSLSADPRLVAAS